MNLHLTLSGPFLTTKVLDPQRLGGTNGNISQLRASYGQIQSRLSKHLSDVDVGWNIFESAVEADTDYDGRSYSGSAIFPEFLAQCTLSGADLTDAVMQWKTDPHTDKFTEDTVCGVQVQSGTITFTACRVSIQDFGAGIVEIDLKWVGLGDEVISEVRAQMEALTTSFASLSSILAGYKLKQFLDCLEKFSNIGRVFTTMSSGASDQYSASKPKILWIHRLYAVTSQNWNGSEAALANEMLARHHVEACENVSINQSVSLYPSIGGSLAFQKEPHVGNYLAFAEPLRSAISLQNAYNAGIWMFDDILFGRTVELMQEQDQIVTDNVKLESVMDHAHSILRLSSYISTFLSVLHNRISRSSPQQLILTESIYHAWRMQLQRNALEKKLEVLQDMYQVTLKLLADSEARRLNRLVLGFTLLSVVTAFIALVDFGTKTEEFEISSGRASLAVGLIVLIVGSYFAVRYRRHKSALRSANTKDDAFDQLQSISKVPFKVEV